MSTRVFGEGNIGSPPEFREFPNDSGAPSRKLRLNVFFDNPVPLAEGGFEDRGGYWETVEIWHKEAERWATLYQKGMRVVVQGRRVRETWKDKDMKSRETYKTIALNVGILPYRIDDIAMSATPSDPEEAEPADNE